MTLTMFTLIMAAGYLSAMGTAFIVVYFERRTGRFPLIPIPAWVPSCLSDSRAFITVHASIFMIAAMGVAGLSDDPVSRMVWVFAAAIVGASFADSYANERWSRLATRCQDLVDLLLANLKAHETEHSLGWWELTDQGAEERSKEH